MTMTDSREETRVFSDKVIVEEKVDGSQLVFLVSETNGTLNIVTKKGTEVKVDDRDFAPAVKEIGKMAGHVRHGWIYIVEFLRGLQHNKIMYNEVPRKGLMLVDVTMKDNSFLNRQTREKEAKRLGIECLPLLWEPTDHEKELTSYILVDLFREPAYLGGLLVPGLIVKENVGERTWNSLNIPRGTDISVWARNRK